MICKSRRRLPESAAFTLIELLVVIVIIAILAGLSLAVTGTVRKSADRTKCLSNLRNIGGAMSRYIGEHDGLIPGPFYTWQSCWYIERDRGTIGTKLAPYFGATPAADYQRIDILICPAWQRGGPYRQDECYLLNTEIVVDGVTLNPWGDADIDEDETASDPTAPGEPKLLSRFADLSLSRIWAMQDLDQRSPIPKMPGGIAPKPVHGDKRNALFFDFHVESVPLDYKP